MANLKGSDNPFPSILMRETVDPANPAVGDQRLFVDTDHLLKMRDSSGTVTVFGLGFSDPMTTRGDIIYRNSSNVTARLGRGSATQVLTSDGTDLSWQTPSSGFADPMTTRGDIIVRNSSNTTARLATGAAGTVLRGGTDPSYGFPPGYEFDYTQATSAVNTTSTTAGSPDTIITSGSVTYDGSTAVLVEFFCAQVWSGIGGNSLIIDLYEDSTRLGEIGRFRSDGSAGLQANPCRIARRLTPSNASHAYSIRSYFDFANTSTRQFAAGSGSGPALMPMFIRITKAA